MASGQAGVVGGTSVGCSRAGVGMVCTWLLDQAVFVSVKRLNDLLDFLGVCAHLFSWMFSFGYLSFTAPSGIRVSFKFD